MDNFIPLINIIIPCYYKSSIIRPCFQSLAEQTLCHNINIIMVNDCSPNTNCEYLDIRKEFSSLHIQYLKTKENCGPGAARNLGLQAINNNAQYVMFIDDDDKLDNPFVIENYLRVLLNQDGKEHIIFMAGHRIHKERDGTILNREDMYCGLTGSVFDYNFIQLFNLRFNENYFEEDTIFFLQFFFYLQLVNINFDDLLFTFKEDPSFIAYNYVENCESLTADRSDSPREIAWNFLTICYNMLLFFKKFLPYFNLHMVMKDELQSYYSQISFFTQLLNNMQLTKEEKIKLKEINGVLLELINYFNCYIDLETIQMMYNNNNNMNFLNTDSKIKAISLEEYKAYLDNFIYV